MPLNGKANEPKRTADKTPAMKISRTLAMDFMLLSRFLRKRDVNTPRAAWVWVGFSSARGGCGERCAAYSFSAAN